MKKLTWHLHIEGLVQGVGFRPYIYKYALKNQLTGWVNNSNDGVHFVYNASEKDAQQICQEVIQNAPHLSRITNYKQREIANQIFNSFEIKHSEPGGKIDLLITPDFAMCEDCQLELNTDSDRRYAYPFITCTLCGPRYSIITAYPYDRPNTSMDPFSMCPKCMKEYDNPLDRRYFSQTNSCSICGIQIKLLDRNSNILATDTNEVLNQINELLINNKIIAVKGVGGYLLMCNATDAEVIRELRKRKRRPSKAFALLYPSLQLLKEDVNINEAEVKEIKSHVSPIVLLHTKKKIGSGICLNEIAPGLNSIGAMLPYAPLLEMIASSFAKPLIATSANISNSPIIAQDEAAISNLSKIADYFLLHQREITIPQDDSVVRLSTSQKQKLIIRRSRGIAPTYDNANIKWSELSILATGADMKSSFALLNNKRTYISQYLGDLTNYSTQQNYSQLIDRYFEIFKPKTEIILCDKHPDYHSTRTAQTLAKSKGASLFYVQHHEAHFAAILAEHTLLDRDDKVLGVIWDGTGYGSDGQIWGGEFFLYDQRSIHRIAHIPYFSHIARDKMALEPRLSALSFFYEIEQAEDILRAKFSEVEWNIYNTLLRKTKRLTTSSVGRIFDSVASILGLADLCSYEGEAAMYLESLASQYLEVHKNALSSYIKHRPNTILDAFQQLKMGLIDALVSDRDIGSIAANFHYTLVDIIIFIAEKAGVHKIAFSGGVFQNGLLVDMIIGRMKGNYQIYFHNELPANDENIAFGQLAHYHAIQKQRLS